MSSIDKSSINHNETVDIPSVLKKNGNDLGTLAELDEAAIVLQNSDNVEFSVDEDRRILRLVDLWVLTPMCLVYLLQQLDKSAVSYSAVFGIVSEAHLVGTQYSWLSSIVYVAQLVFQPLSSYALVKLPVAKWVTFNVFCWGTVVACMGAAHNFKGLITARFFLGVFEATVAPSFIAITQMWWRRREQTYRTMAWNCSNAVASILGPLLAFGIGHVHNGIRPYQGIFLFMGCLTIAATPLVYWMLPNSPTSAKFLSKGNDRVIAIERLRSNNMGTENKLWKWHQCREALMDIKTWGWAIQLFLVACPSGGIGAFGGLIVKGFVKDSFKTILFQMPFGGVSFVSIVLTGWITNKIRLRFPVIAVVALFPIVGAICLWKLPRTNKGGLLAAYYVVSISGCLQPLLYSWANLNAAGHTKKIVTTAVLFVAQCVGNIIGPLVYKTAEAPFYRTGLTVDLALWSALVVVSLSMGAYLHYLNKKQERRRVAAGRIGAMLDTSIMTLEEAEAYKASRSTGNESGDTVPVNAHAFEDLTDFENMDFIYVL